MKSIYQDFKEWENFKFPLEITNLSFEKSIYTLAPESVITVWREDDYKLRATIEGISSDRKTLEGEKETPGNFAALETIHGISLDRMSVFKLEGCVIDGGTFTIADPINVSFRFNSPLHFHSLTQTPTYAPPQEGEIIRLEWFLSNHINVLFPRFTKRSVDQIFVKARQGFDTEDEFNKLAAQGSARDYLSLDTSSFKCFVAEVPKEFGPAWAKCLCIEYRSSLTIPDSDSRSAVNELMSFILGTHLLPIGSTTLAEGNITEQVAFSPWGDNVRSKCSKPSFPPVQLNNYYDWGRVELLANKLLPTYLEKSKPLELSSTLWKFWIAKELPVGVNLPILSSAIEVLVNKYLANVPGITYTYMPSQDYLKLIADDLASIEFKLKDIPHHQKILNKIKSAFNRGANEKMELFFEKLELPIGEIEQQAIRARNTMAHGGVNLLTDEEVKEVIRKTRAYETLFNRIMLKLLGYDDYYIDYYKEGHPSKKIEIPTGEDKAVSD